MNAAQVIREAAALRGALYTYAAAYDMFAELAQRYMAEEREIEAAGALDYAQRCLRAYRAELDDPEPEGLERE